eukprot:INCI1174.1.p1 GENE.INCI1174.1~~INCI1174.1.p1  ORF type:complete len:1026 (-),score=162.81 INCI1174.1:2105-5182(-)
MERAQNKCERIVLEALYNIVETVLEDRVSLDPRHYYTKDKPPFNFDRPLNEAVRGEMNLWKHNVYSPLVLDVMHLQPGSNGSAPKQVLLERWQALFVPKRSEGSTREVTAQLRAAYRRMSIFLRTLFCMLRILPATKVARACRRAMEQAAPTARKGGLSDAGQVQYAVYSQPSSLEQKLLPTRERASHFAAANAASITFGMKWDCNSYKFTDIPTPFGTLTVFLEYRRSISSPMGSSPSASTDGHGASGAATAIPRQIPQGFSDMHSSHGGHGGADPRYSDWPQQAPNPRQQYMHSRDGPGGMHMNSGLAPQSMPDRLGYMHPRTQQGVLQGQPPPNMHPMDAMQHRSRGSGSNAGHRNPRHSHGFQGQQHGPGWGADGSSSGSSGTNSSMSSGRGSLGRGKRTPSWEQSLSQAGSFGSAPNDRHHSFGGRHAHSQSQDLQHHQQNWAGRRHSDAPLPSRGSLASALQPDTPSPLSSEFVPPSRQRSHTVSGSGKDVASVNGGASSAGWSAPVAIQGRPRNTSNAGVDHDPLDGYSAEGVGIPRSVSNEQLKFMGQQTHSLSADDGSGVMMYGSLPARFARGGGMGMGPYNYAGNGMAPQSNHGGHWGRPNPFSAAAANGPSTLGMDIPVDGAALRSRQRSGMARRDRDSFDSVLGSMSPHSGSGHSAHHYMSQARSIPDSGGDGEEFMFDDDGNGLSASGQRRWSGPSSGPIEVTGRYHRRNSSGGEGSFDSSAPIHINRETPPRYPSQSGSLGRSGSYSRPRNSLERLGSSGGRSTNSTPPLEANAMGFSAEGRSYGSSYGSAHGIMGPSSLDNASSGSYEARHPSGGSFGNAGAVWHGDGAAPFGKTPRGASPLIPPTVSSMSTSSNGSGSSAEPLFGIARMEVHPEHGGSAQAMETSLLSTLRGATPLLPIPDDDESQLMGSSMGGALDEEDDDDDDCRASSPMLPFALEYDTDGSPSHAQRHGGDSERRHAAAPSSAVQLMQKCSVLQRDPPPEYADPFRGKDARGFSLVDLQTLARQLN